MLEDELDVCDECPNPDICHDGGFCVEAALPDGAHWDDPEALS